MQTTESASTGRRGRPPRGTALLSRDAILDTAIAAIDDEGVAAVSMRTVARRLGVDAKSLYNHVDGKDALLDGVAERILSGVEMPAPTGSLEDDLRAIAHAFRRGTLAHPHAATLVLTRQLSSLAGLAPIEAVISVLLQAGATPAEAVHLLRTLLAGLIGTLLREVEAGPTFGVTDPDGIARRQGVLAGSDFPALAETARYLARCDHDAEFDFTVDLMIGAVTARLGGRTTSR